MPYPQILYRDGKEYQVRVPTQKEFDRLAALLTLPYKKAVAIDRQAVCALKNCEEKILPPETYVQGKSEHGTPVCMIASARADSNTNISAIKPFTKVYYYERKTNIPASRICGFSPVLQLLTPRAPDDGPLPDVLDDIGMFFDNTPQKGKTAIAGNKIWNSRIRVSFAVTDLKSAKNTFVLVNSNTGLYFCAHPVLGQVRYTELERRGFAGIEVHDARDKIYYHEVVFENNTEICIKSAKDFVSIEELNVFLAEDCAKFGKVIKTFPIDERSARSCYDFSNEPNWPILF